MADNVNCYSSAQVCFSGRLGVVKNADKTLGFGIVVPSPEDVKPQ